MELVQGVLSATDCLCTEDAQNLLGWRGLNEIVCGGHITDADGELYRAVWSGTDEAEGNVCQVCGVLLAETKGE